MVASPPIFQSLLLERPAPATLIGDIVLSPPVAAPAFSASLAYFDSYRSARLPANLLQAQRDFFGAHTYERIDKPGIFHTDWIGDQPAQEITEPKPASKR